MNNRSTIQQYPHRHIRIKISLGKTLAIGCVNQGHGTQACFPHNLFMIQPLRMLRTISCVQWSPLFAAHVQREEDSAAGKRLWVGVLDGGRGGVDFDRLHNRIPTLQLGELILFEINLVPTHVICGQERIGGWRWAHGYVNEYYILCAANWITILDYSYIGAGIAQVAASTGHKVALTDVSKSVLDGSMLRERMTTIWTKAVVLSKAVKFSYT